MPTSANLTHFPALGQMDASRSGKMSFIAIAYYLTTVIIASCIGVAMVFLFHPGDPDMRSHRPEDVVIREDNNISALDSILDLIRNMFPQNIVEATMYRSQTAFVVVRKKILKNGTITPVLMRKTIKLTQGTNILGRPAYLHAYNFLSRTDCILHWFWNSNLKTWRQSPSDS